MIVKFFYANSSVNLIMFYHVINQGYDRQNYVVTISIFLELKMMIQKC